MKDKSQSILMESQWIQLPPHSATACTLPYQDKGQMPSPAGGAGRLWLLLLVPWLVASVSATPQGGAAGAGLYDGE